MERLWVILMLLGLVGLSIVKAYVGVDDATTVLIATIAGAVLGFYFKGVEK